LSPGTEQQARGLTGFVSVVGFEAALLAELGLGKADGPRWPGLVTTRQPASALLPDPAFALQLLPQAQQVAGDSVRALAEAADAAIADRLEASTGPIVLQVYVPDRIAYRNIAGRAALLESAFVEHLRQTRRQVSKRLRAASLEPAKLSGGDPPAVDHAGERAQAPLQVQLALVGRTSLLVSAAVPRPLPQGGTDLSPFAGGTAPVPEDRAAPSRAYRKLVEGFAWMGREPRPGQTCVDLGGAPGGWAFTALSRGAKVIAVDRSPLAPAAADHPGLTMVIGNAFTYRPPAPVDWLLCDVICEPAKTIALCEQWIDQNLCRQVVATLKFKGTADYPAIAQARSKLARKTWPLLRIKHLRNHNNEAVILMTRA
jgi:23S rRNA (cytidine2498-2'-O)-methyltransferase